VSSLRRKKKQVLYSLRRNLSFCALVGQKRGKDVLIQHRQTKFEIAAGFIL
jgi:hypothetical protein